MAKTIKVGIIGTGSIAQNQHMPGYRKCKDVEIAAVCDVNETAAKAAAEKFNVPKVFSDYRDLLALRDIDAVSVCTPNKFHAAPTIAALQAGKHVMVEKPIAMNAKEGLAMCRAAKKARRILAVGLHFRYDENVLALKRYADEGAFGEIYFIRAQALRRRGIPSWGVFYSKELNGGGPLIDIGVHIIYAAIFVAGFPEPTAVSGISLTKFGNRNDVLPGSWGMWNWKEYNVEDNAFAFVRLEGGGAMSVETSFVANIPEEVFSFQVFGTKGGGRMSPAAYMGEQAGTLVNVQPVWLPKSEAHAREIADFIGAIRGECRVGVTGEEGLKVTRIIDAIYESAKLGREVKIPKLKI